MVPKPRFTVDLGWENLSSFLLHKRSYQLYFIPCFFYLFLLHRQRGSVTFLGLVFLFVNMHIMCGMLSVCPSTSYLWHCEATGLMKRVARRVLCRRLFWERSHSVCAPLVECNTVPVHLSYGGAPGATGTAQGEHPGVDRAAQRMSSSGRTTRGPGAAQTQIAPTAISSPPWPRRPVLGASRCWPGVTAHPVPGVPGSCPKQVVSTEWVYVLLCFLGSTQPVQSLFPLASSKLMMMILIAGIPGKSEGAMKISTLSL